MLTELCKSRYGTDLVELRRSPQRRHSPLLPADLIWVPDATLETSFQFLESLGGESEIRFYAAAPLVTHDGHTLGSLCVMDRQTREEDGTLGMEETAVHEQPVERLHTETAVHTETVAHTEAVAHRETVVQAAQA